MEKKYYYKFGRVMLTFLLFFIVLNTYGQTFFSYQRVEKINADGVRTKIDNSNNYILEVYKFSGDYIYYPMNHYLKWKYSHSANGWQIYYHVGQNVGSGAVITEFANKDYEIRVTSDHREMQILFYNNGKFLSGEILKLIKTSN